MARYKTKLKSITNQKHSLLPLWLALAGLGLLLVAGWALWNSNAPSKGSVEVKGAPRLKVEKDLIDHGDMKLGNQIHDSVRVTNIGDQPLRFTEAPYLEVKEGCWPPVPAIGSMVLQPGESTVISFDYLMHGGMAGKHDFRLHLKTNDKTQPDKEVTFLSNWVP